MTLEGFRPGKLEECKCPIKTCRPEENEGRVCWRSQCYIPPGYFTKPSSPPSI